MQTAGNEFDIALVEAAKGGTDFTFIKNQKRQVLIQLLSALGMYVELNSNGDEAISLTSGYELAKKPTPVGALPKPSGLVATDGANAGEIDLKNDSMAGAGGFNFPDGRSRASCLHRASPCLRRSLSPRSQDRSVLST